MSVGDETKHSAESVLSLLQEHFYCATDGSIRDSEGHGWMVWNLVDFHRWWLAVETFSGVPLGRKLLNAAADQEEYFLTTNSILDGGWFRKKRRQNTALSNRWNLMGWGFFDLDTSLLTSNLMAPLCSGFALAATENISQSRSKIQWQQLSNNTIRLEFESIERQFSAAPASPVLCWDSSSPPNASSSSFNLDLQTVSNGWTHAGERSSMLANGIFARFFETLTMQGIQLRPDWLECWKFPDSIDTRSQVPLVLCTLAVNQLVSESEQPIYIQDVRSWDQLIDAYLVPFGFGKPLQISPLDEQGGVEFLLPPSSQWPLLVGYLFSFWQRGFGRRARVEIQLKNENWSVQISSLLSYTD